HRKYRQIFTHSNWYATCLESGCSRGAWLPPRPLRAGSISTSGTVSELGEELPRRDVYERVVDERRYELPVRLVVEHDADPAARADVRRTEEAIWRRSDEVRLRAIWQRQPHRHVLRSVMMIVEHREALALAREPRRLSV